MITNADITIFNQKFNKETRETEWHRTVLEGVSFHAELKAVPGEKGLNKARIYKIRIPADVKKISGYLEEDIYFDSTDVTKNWTLQEGDLVVKGGFEQEIKRPADLTALHKTYCRIVSWSDNRIGTLPHWRVTGE